MTKDRITLAWELRRDIHDFLRANINAPMAIILDYFAHRRPETIRKAIQRMRNDGDVCMTGGNRAAGRYSAATTAIRPETVSREKMGYRAGHEFNRGRMITVGSEVKTIEQWGADSSVKITAATIRKRLAQGFSHSEAVYGKDAPIAIKTPQQIEADRKAAEDKMRLQYLKAEGLVDDSRVTITDPKNPARTIHRGNKRQHPIPEQRGQGAAQSYYRGGCTCLEAI